MTADGFRRACTGGHASCRVVLVLAAVVASLTLAGCGAAVLADAHSSDEALAAAVLDALARRDADALVRLALTQEEFEAIVWPRQPASKAEVGMPASYVWRDTTIKSRAHLARTLETWGGRRLQLIRVEFGGATTDHVDYVVSRATRLVVRDEAGAERTVRIFGSLIRQGSSSKVYSYIID